MSIDKCPSARFPVRGPRAANGSDRTRLGSAQGPVARSGRGGGRPRRFPADCTAMVRSHRGGPLYGARPAHRQAVDSARRPRLISRVGRPYRDRRPLGT
jgi:hypothetical protein